MTGARRDATHGTPSTSKALCEAYAAGAEAFGWDGRPLAPRTLRDGRGFAGLGTATDVWEADFQAASARARPDHAGRLEVASVTADIGTGTHTAMIGGSRRA